MGLFFPENEADHQKFCSPLAQTRKGFRDLVRHEAACSNDKTGEANSQKKRQENRSLQRLSWELSLERLSLERLTASKWLIRSLQRLHLQVAPSLKRLCQQWPQRKPKALPAPSKAQWNDVHYTMKKLEKAGKMDLPEKWKKACLGGHQCKREFYYHTFHLDPEASKKEVHKISLERLSVESTKLRGWFTKWQLGEMQGAVATHPMFEQLCIEACKGLPERDHENEAWARLGVKQYYFEHFEAEKERHVNESTTAAKQTVEASDRQDFQKAENGQVVFGKKSHKAEAAASAGEEKPEEAYKKADQSLNKAAKAFSSAVDKLQLLKTSLAKKQKEQPNAQLAASVGEMESLQNQHEDLKSQWVTRLAAVASSFPADAASDGSETEKLQQWKQEIEEQNKSLGKALNPHRLWAKNAGFI